MQPFRPYAVLDRDGHVLTRALRKNTALAGARRRVARGADGLQVVWCANGVPKLWLAFVGAEGVRKTAFWVVPNSRGKV